MAERWTRESVLELMKGYQASCAIAAGAELDLFSALGAGPAGAAELAERVGADVRGLTILLDALAAMGLLVKQGAQYDAPPEVAELLGAEGGRSVLGTVRHHANCMRRWTQLARVVQTGRRAKRIPSVRGEVADLAAFITAMNELSEPFAASLAGELGKVEFRRLLDVGGGSGTWTVAFLRRCRQARAVIFDLPDVIPMARRRIARAGLAERVEFVAGDFETGPLPGGADLVWVSAIVHQNCRAENRDLFAKAFAALIGGGRILIRDAIVDESRTSPPDAAMFAINMLVSTPGGGTYTFNELSEDLRSAGFVEPTLLRQGSAMDSLLLARKPA